MTSLYLIHDHFAPETRSEARKKNGNESKRRGGSVFAEMIPVTVKNKKWELWRTRSLSKDDRVFH